MNSASFNVKRADSSFVSRFSRRLAEIAVSRRYLIIPTVDIVEAAQIVTHLEQITTIRRLGWDGRLSGALEPAQSVARLHTSQTRSTETEPRNR